MNKLLKSIAITLAGALILMLFIGCTPGKAQTRGNENKGGFQNEEFEAFDSNKNSNEDEIPSMNKSKNSDYEDKYGNNKTPYVKSDNGYGNQNNKGYSEVKGKYSDSEIYNDEPEEKAIGKKKNYNYDTENEETSSEKFYQKGVASWYGREFHGKTTASGERFDMNDLTAAHKTLPFGSIVDVKNIDNGKSVRVKINDRGPYRGNRIIDLSFSGAKELGMIKSGEANVGIKVIKIGDGSTALNDDSDRRYIEPVADDEAYTQVKSERQGDYNDGLKLQAGAFYSRKNAENLKYRIEGLTDRPVKVIEDGGYYKVRVEGLRDKRESGKLKSRLNEDNITSFTIE